MSYSIIYYLINTLNMLIECLRKSHLLFKFHYNDDGVQYHVEARESYWKSAEKKTKFKIDSVIQPIK